MISRAWKSSFDGGQVDLALYKTLISDMSAPASISIWIEVLSDYNPRFREAGLALSELP